MKIDPSSRIRPPRYSDPLLRKLMGRWIAEDSEDDRTAAYLWRNELRATLNMIANWGALCDELRVAHDEVKARLKLPVPQEGAPGWFPVSREWSANELALKDALYQELNHCVRGKWRCEAVQTKLLEAADGDLKARYDRANAVPPQTIDPLVSSDEDLIATRTRIADIWSRDEQRRADLHLLDAKRLEFMRDIRSVDLQAIDRALSPNFEPMLASWLRRDAWDIEREGGGPNDLHADLIATSPCGVRVAFQAKHSQWGEGTVGTTPVAGLAGTAEKIHKADIAAIVTNRKFSKPATTLAGQLGVRLIGRAELTQWATWGDPLLTVLEHQMLVVPSNK